MSPYVPPKTCTKMFIRSFCTAATHYEQPGCPAPAEWLEVLWCLHRTKYWNTTRQWKRMSFLGRKWLGWISQTLCDAKEVGHTNELIYPIYLKLKSRPHKSVVMPVGIVSYLGGAGQEMWLWQTEEIKMFSISNRGAVWGLRSFCQNSLSCTPQTCGLSWRQLLPQEKFKTQQDTVPSQGSGSEHSRESGPARPETQPTDPVSPLRCSDEGPDVQRGCAPQSKGRAEPGLKTNPPEVTNSEIH